MIFRRKNHKQKNAPIVEEIIDLWEMGNEIDPTDILGSYTGTPNYENEFSVKDLEPEQDPDDL